MPDKETLCSDRPEPPVLLVDTREKWTQAGSEDRHIRNYLERNKIAYTVQKLDVGDYMFRGGTVVVDRKKNLDELACNLLNRKDSVRFWNEVRLAAVLRLRLVVLCEHSDQIRSLADAAKWKSKYSGITGKRLVDAMIRCEMAYGVRFLFCGKRSTGKRILEILNGKP